MTGGEASRRYHQLSKHDRERLLRLSFTDWSDEPRKVKEYPGAPAVELPAAPLPGVKLSDIVAGKSEARREAVGPADIAALLHYGYGATLKRSGFALRAAPSAGALYPAELYLCCGDIEGGELEAGVYSYNPETNAAVRIRDGDFRKAVAEALGDGQPAAAYLLISAIPWRSAWKYGARAYRYCLLDSGHLAGNLLLAGSALGLEPRLAARLREEPLNELLGLDGEKEFVMATVTVLPDPAALTTAPPPPQVAPRPAAPVSRRKGGHGGGREDAVAAARRAESRDGTPVAIAPAVSAGERGLKLGDGELAAGELGKLILKRRSHREPARGTAPAGALASFLRTATWSYPADWLPDAWQANLLPELRVVVVDVKDVPKGLYRYEAGERRLLPIEISLNEGALAAACMGQRFAERANAVLAIGLDFNRLEDADAYRVAGLDAGVVGQLAYLAAGSVGAGCCGVGAFFDDDLSSLLRLDADNCEVLYALTLAMR